jgi:hypothetical protein
MNQAIRYLRCEALSFLSRLEPSEQLRPLGRRPRRRLSETIGGAGRALTARDDAHCNQRQEGAAEGAPPIPHADQSLGRGIC